MSDHKTKKSKKQQLDITAASDSEIAAQVEQKVKKPKKTKLEDGSKKPKEKKEKKRSREEVVETVDTSAKPPKKVRSAI